MTNGFIKNEELLEETHEREDLLDFSEIKESFKKELENINKSSIFGLVGPFGVGKSTMLYQLSKNHSTDEQWVYFDAWKYPERNNLWEGFVLDLVRSIDPKLFEKVRKKIDGEQGGDIKSLLKVLAQGVSIFNPGFGVIENFGHLFKSSPARRVFEFQEILEKFINSTKKNVIYIVIEDIDRSGDRGRYFLETLRQFIRSVSLKKKVICIVPIGTTSFNDERDSYLKSVDYYHQFEHKRINFTQLIKESFSEEVADTEIKIAQLDQLLRLIMQADRDPTIRTVKNVLRNSNLRYASLSDPTKKSIDVRVFISIYAAKRIGDKELTQNINNELRLNTYYEWLARFLVAVALNRGEVVRANGPIVFMPGGPAVPEHFRNDINTTNPNQYLISDVYLSL